MEQKRYTKLSEQVDHDFTVEKVWGFKWKMWDATSSKMLVSDTYEKGYRKVYSVDTDQGSMDLSANQIANMLEGVQHAGVADINGATFHVKSNGKTGIDIRYYINPTRVAKVEKTDTVYMPEEPIDMSEIPF